MAHKTIVPTEKEVDEHYKGNGKPQELKLKASTHRRILNFLNEATRPEDLMYEKIITHDEGNLPHEDNPEELELKRKKIMTSSKDHLTRTYADSVMFTKQEKRNKKCSRILEIRCLK